MNHLCLTLREDAAEAGARGAGCGQTLYPGGLCDARLFRLDLSELRLLSGATRNCVSVRLVSWGQSDQSWDYGSGIWQVLTQGSPPLPFQGSLRQKQ